MGTVNSSQSNIPQFSVGCPVKSSTVSNESILQKDECPVKSEISSELQYNPITNDFKFDQNIHPSQIVHLSTTRAVSSIPKSEEITPTHQPVGVDRWVYPSEQQYYNAMKRKGYNPPEKDMSVILAIHNLVNEQGWSKIKEWESLRGNDSPKLKSFTGRPKDISPKAYLSHIILGYSKPFDRHDWIIRRGDEDIRYVIDFYKGSSSGKENSPVSIYLDVRPAVDSISAFVDILSFEYRRRFYSSSLPKSSLKTSKFYSDLDHYLSNKK